MIIGTACLADIRSGVDGMPPPPLREQSAREAHEEGSGGGGERQGKGACVAAAVARTERLPPSLHCSPPQSVQALRCGCLAKRTACVIVRLTIYDHTDSLRVVCTLLQYAELSRLFRQQRRQYARHVVSSQTVGTDNHFWVSQ